MQRQKIFRLSQTQQRLWFMSRLKPESAFYNLPLLVRLRGRLNIGALEQALNEISRRHEVLRTKLVEIDEVPMQVIDEPSTQKLELIEADGSTEGLRIVREEVRKPFELTKDLLWRAFLVRVSDEEHLLAVVIHHIVSDGWSLNVLANELSALYSTYAAGHLSPLKELPVQWGAYAEWQRESVSADDEERQLRYWKEQLAGSPPVLQLPSDRPRPPVESYEGSMYYTTLPASLAEALKSLSRSESNTLYTTLLAAFNVLIFRYTGQTDLNIGMPLAGRNSPDVENLIGFFVNTVAIRTKLSADLRFRDLMAGVRETTIAAYAHQDVQFDKVVDELKIERSLSYAPVFQIVFAYNPGNLTFELLDLEATRLDIDTQTSKFDLAFFVEDAGAGLKLLIEYSTVLFDTATIERLTTHFQTLLESIVADPDETISTLKLLTYAENDQLLTYGRGASKESLQQLCIQELFELQAEHTPDALAVVWGNERITYDTLNQRANQLAHHLQSMGVGPETIIGLCMTRSLNMIVGALGILKAGGAYAPLDPAYPKERIALMLEETAAPLLLTERAVFDRLPDCNAQIVCLEDEKETLAAQSNLNSASSARPENLAYVIFTSGSTGKPKGTALTHTGLVNLACWHQETFAVDHHAKVSLVAGPSFDAAVWELWSNLTSGATLYLANAETILSPTKLWQWLNDHDITHCFLPTPLVETLLPVCEADSRIDTSLRYLFTGGDKLHRRPNRDLPFRLVNLYGLSESTVVNTSAVIVSRAHNDAVPPIGRPINNSQVYILDRQLQRVPVGVVGELYISGVGVGRGYLNQPDLTAAKFIPDPYAIEVGERMYRTGDLARYLPDGTIECLGRIDGQVKIRGFRIELGEIETALAQHEGVREAVVVVRPDGRGSNHIVAYVVENGKQAATAEELRTYLKKTLPEYMVPAVFVTLEALPLTPNGKVDHKKLPDVDNARPDREEHYVRPRSEIERAVAEIWQDVLQVTRVGIHDNFFNLGGHSLLLVQVNSRLREVLQADISMIDMFRYPTVSALAEYLGQATVDRNKLVPYRPQAARNGRRSGHDAMEVAIVGMAGRFPGAKNLAKFWHNLKNSVESVTFFSDSELKAAGVNGELGDPNFVPAKAVLEDVEMFDAAFFDYNPREAEMLDPQHRVLLECAVEALEHAGYDPDRFAGRIGVYAGVSAGSYLGVNLNSHPDLIEKVGAYQVEIGNRGDFAPTTISFKLNLKGPSLNIQTACSTSLVAVHTACQSLLSGDCDMALAGGGSITFPHKNGYVYQKEGIMSPDGHCRAFDENGRGTVAGEGAGLVVLKRLTDAVADGDTIHAVIKGSAINNDGSLKVGFTAPSIDGQAKVISEALTAAGVNAGSIDYVETHGTGTILGDPIEIAALTQAYHAGTEQRGFCAIGSLKTNIGHLDAAAGIAGLIKTTLALTHKQIPASLHFEAPNSKINFEQTPFFVNAQLRDWTARNGRRRTGVSSFGIGGTNAHVILEEAPPATFTDRESGAELLILSAKTKSALKRATQQLVDHLTQHPEISLGDVAFTLQVGRRELAHRRVLVSRDADDAIRELKAPASQRVFSSSEEPGYRPCMFMFPGQGTQYAGMSKELYQTQPVFRQEIDRCAELLLPHLNLDPRDAIYPDAERFDEASQLLTQTFLTQPAMFMVEYALARLLMSWGVEPAAMIGHSIGEYVAACVGGVFSLADALALVAARGALLQKLPPGQMLAVPLPENEVRDLLPRGLSLAVVNAPKSCVVAGPPELVQEFQSVLSSREIHSQLLKTSHAFHSEMLEPILDEFTNRASQVNLSAPAIPFVSNVTGTWITAAEATDPHYWTRHLRQTVRFADGMAELFHKPDWIVIEVGPGRTLRGLAKQNAPKSEGQVILNTLSGPRNNHSDAEELLNALGKLWLAGGRVDWLEFSAGKQRRRVPLPTYPFERKRYYVEPHARAFGSNNGARTHRSPIENWLYVPSWKRVPVGGPEEALQEGAWLVFVDAGGVGAELAKRLWSASRHAVTVKAGKRFSKAGKNDYTIDPRRGEDYQSLLKAVSAAGVRRVVHLWSLTDDEADNRFASAQEPGLNSLIFLTQALAKDPTPAQLLVVTNSTQEVSGDEVLQPEKATILSACKVIPLEHRHISCRSVDVIIGDRERLVAQLLGEVIENSPDRVIAYRGRHRWAQTFEPVADYSPKEQTRLRERGVYMITDGLSRMGLTVARFLAQTVRARLVLLTRDELPDGREVGGEFEAMGAELFVHRADQADEKQMREALTSTESRFGELHGVIHTGSATNIYKNIIELTPSDCDRPVGRIVAELMALEKILAGRQMDFCLVFSSLLSVLGGSKLTAAVAANILSDVTVQKHAQQTMENWTSINWDRLEDGSLDLDGELSIREHEVGQVLARVLSLAPGPQVVVSTTELQSRLASIPLRSAGEIPGQVTAQAEVVQPSSPAFAAPGSRTEKVLAGIWQDLLGIDCVGVHDNFFDLDGHSLLGTIMISRIRRSFGVDLELTEIFQAPTVDSLSLLIEQRVAEQQDKKRTASAETPMARAPRRGRQASA